MSNEEPRHQDASPASNHDSNTVVQRPGRGLKLALGVVLIAVAAGLALWLWSSPSGESAAFDAMVEQLRTAKTARFRMTFRQESKPDISSEMLVSDSVTRMESPGRPIGVMDQDSGRRLILMPDRKRAVLMHVRPGAEAPATRAPEPSQAYATQCLNRVKNMRDDERMTYQGQREVDGRTVHEYEASHPEAPMTILVETETNAPYRFSVQMPDEAGTLVMSDFVLNADLDPALFSFTAPEGYQLMEVPPRGSTPQTKNAATPDRPQTQPE